jgi:hypothetical protein
VGDDRLAADGDEGGVVPDAQLGAGAGGRTRGDALDERQLGDS